jgi:hypothetical protein
MLFKKAFVKDRLFTRSMVGREGSDCTAPYEIDLIRRCTVKEFVSFVLTLEEWGMIGIYN